MTLHHAHEGLHDPVPSLAAPVSADPWRFRWPNPADFNFNYWELLDRARRSGTGIGTIDGADRRVAIVGAGVAGLVAARELLRCGFKVDIYETSDRIGGRLHSLPVEGQRDTCMELGAMRMPFFPSDGQDGTPGTRNCVLDYYASEFGMETVPFPNPDGATPCGIYLNEGHGPDPGSVPGPKMLIWDTPEPPHPLLAAVRAKWLAFATRFEAAAIARFDSAGAWETFWGAVRRRYDRMTFRDLVWADAKPASSPYTDADDGDLGGLGMTGVEAELFYVMGMGDGGWGAFYDISALFPIRTILCGFGRKHQLVVRCAGLEGEPPGAFADSLGNSLSAPHFMGIQSLPESLLYRRTPSGGSLYEAVQAGDAGLYTGSAVRRIIKEADHVEIRTASAARRYDAVVVTAPTWALQMSASLSGFDAQQLTWQAKRTLKTSHWISSCKVFFRLSRRYWDDKRLPQLFATDTFLQGCYGYAVGDDPGVLLVSYTWEDDAAKMLTDETEQEVATRCLEKLDRILEGCGLPRISGSVVKEGPVVIHWTRRFGSRGCSKLYRCRTDEDNRSLLTHNQTSGAASRLYFAGEGYSVEGGWTEPALRMGLDAVMHLLKDAGGRFTVDGFDFDRDYPKWA